jgi:hypothetical protein
MHLLLPLPKHENYAWLLPELHIFATNINATTYNYVISLRIDSLGVEFELPMFPSTLMLEVRVRVSVDASHTHFLLVYLALQLWGFFLGLKVY